MASHPATQRRRDLKHRRLMARFKRFKGCARCGYRDDTRALEFHHRDPAQKFCRISAMAFFSRCRIKDELAKCDVLCGNCHNIETLAARGVVEYA